MGRTGLLARRGVLRECVPSGKRRNAARRSVRPTADRVLLPARRVALRLWYRAPRPPEVPCAPNERAKAQRPKGRLSVVFGITPSVGKRFSANSGRISRPSAVSGFPTNLADASTADSRQPNAEEILASDCPLFPHALGQHLFNTFGTVWLARHRLNVLRTVQSAAKPRSNWPAPQGRHARPEARSREFLGPGGQMSGASSIRRALSFKPDEISGRMSSDRRNCAKY
jgi:hypothetical protein